jgi:hypothetical protein
MTSLHHWSKWVYTPSDYDIILHNIILCTFLAKPQSWGEAPRFAVFPPKFTPVGAGLPIAPPAPKTCTVTQTYKSGSPAVPGGG